MRRALSDPSLRTRLLVIVALVAFVARCWLTWVSEGTNDIRTWLRFAKLVNEHGLGQAYVLDPLLNHPPLTALWAGLAGRWSDHSILVFARLFKFPSLIAEAGTAVLLWLVYRRRHDPSGALWAVAIYALALGNVLISAFHGNTDCLYFAFAFLAVYLLQERQSGLWAGLALAAALNVKLIPIVLVLPLAAVCRDRRVFFRYGLGLSVAVLPFALALSTFTPDQRSHFFVNVFGYKSYAEWWGVELVTRTLVAATWRSLPKVTLAIQSLHDSYFIAGGKVLVALTGVLALWARLDLRHPWRGRPPPNAYALSAAAYSIFVLLGPGWGVQYLGCLLAPYVAFQLRSGALVALVSGLLAALIYLHFTYSWTPMSSEHTPFPADFAGISAVTWLVLAAQAWKALCSARAPALSDASSRAG